MTPVSAVIVDDAPLAREKLGSMLHALGGVEVVGQAGDVAGAVEVVNRLEPELLFLDVELIGGTGLDVLTRLRQRPAVIFTTAYESYAVTAFELAAVDYLLKPFGLERLRAAVERALRLLAPPEEPVHARLQELAPERAVLRRMFVEQGGRILPLPMPEVVRLEARENYVLVHARGTAHLVRANLRDLEARLDPAQFLRVHRSHIVNLDYVRAFTQFDPRRLTVELKDGTRIVASRQHSAALRRLR